MRRGNNPFSYEMSQISMRCIILQSDPKNHRGPFFTLTLTKGLVWAEASFDFRHDCGEKSKSAPGNEKTKLSHEKKKLLILKKEVV